MQGIQTSPGWKKLTVRHKIKEPSLGRGSMTPVLLILLFVLLLDLLVLLGWSHDSRDGRDWQPRGAPSPDRSAVGLT
jgi:hypothetical protein